MLANVVDDPTFNKRTITGDETWVYEYDVETAQQSSEWRAKNEAKPKKTPVKVGRKSRTIFGRDEAPSAPGVRKFLRKVRETGKLMDPTEVIHVLVLCAQLKELLLFPKVCLKTKELQLVTEHNNL
ncbi:hypothetical protein NQ318_000140, partial [Aromia moschata]